MKDDAEIFALECASFSYDEPRYVNSLIDYSFWKHHGKRYVRTEVDPYNKLGMYVKKNGTIEVSEGDTILMTFRVSDYAGNISDLDFQVVGESPKHLEPKSYSRSYYQVMADGSQNAEIIIDDFQAITEKGTFFRDEWIRTGARDSVNCVSRIYRYGADDMAVFKPVTIKIRPDEKWTKDKRLFMAYIDGKKNVSSLNGKMVDGFLTVTTRSLGEFAVMVDSIRPKVSAVNFKSGQNISDLTKIKVKISDDMTGINSYDMYFNGVWVLGQYDAKNNLLFYEKDDYLPQGNLKLKVVVTDGVGNKTEYTCNLIN